MKENNLKGCPFCGNENIKTGVSIFGGLHSFACDNCKVSVEFLWKDREKCKEIWNSRTDKK